MPYDFSFMPFEKFPAPPGNHFAAAHRMGQLEGKAPVKRRSGPPKFKARCLFSCLVTMVAAAGSSSSSSSFAAAAAEAGAAAAAAMVGCGNNLWLRLRQQLRLWLQQQLRLRLLLLIPHAPLSQPT